MLTIYEPINYYKNDTVVDANEYYYYRDLAYKSYKIDELTVNLEYYVGGAVYNYALPAYDTVIYYIRATLTRLKPFLIISFPLISQIVLLALGFALIPVLGPFGPLLVQFIGQLILYVIRLLIDEIDDPPALVISDTYGIRYYTSAINPFIDYLSSHYVLY